MTYQIFLGFFYLACEAFKWTPRGDNSAIRNILNGMPNRLEHYRRLLNVAFDWNPDHLSYQPPVEGPPIPIIIDMVNKAISQMKAGKAPGPSDIVVEMIRTAGDMGGSMIRDLAAAIICDGKVPSDWEQSFIACLYKGKGNTLERGNYLSQADRAGYENPGEDCGRPHQTVCVNWRFPVWLRPRQRHYRRNLCCQAAAREVSSCQQETLHGFHRPGEGVRSSTLEGHVVGTEKTWCGGEDCATGAGDVCKCAEPCLCWWGVQWRVWSEGWCSPRISTQPTALHHCAWSLFMRVLLWSPLGKPLCWWLVIIAESLVECVRRLLTWKEAMEKKGLRVNAGKTKIMICGMGLDLLQSSGKFPCTVCHIGVGSNSICNGCKHWVNKKCSGLKRLKKRPWLQMYIVRGNCTPLCWQTTERSPGGTWQAWGGSFLLLPRRHALNSRWLWTFNHNTCENCLEEVQGSATSSVFTPPLFQNTWPCVQLL